MYEGNALRPLDCIQLPRALPRAGCGPSQARCTVSRTLTGHRSGTLVHAPFGLPLQVVAVEHVGNNAIQDRLYGVGFYRVNRRIHSVKLAIGGEGVRPGITTTTSTHKTLQTFFRQLAPFALAHHRRHATFPYVDQDTSASVSPFWGAR